MLSLASLESNNNTEDINRCCYRGCCGRELRIVYDGRHRPFLGNESTDELSTAREESQYDNDILAGTLT